MILWTRPAFERVQQQQNELRDDPDEAGDANERETRHTPHAGQVEVHNITAMRSISLLLFWGGGHSHRTWHYQPQDRRTGGTLHPAIYLCQAWRFLPPDHHPYGTIHFALRLDGGVFRLRWHRLLRQP